MHDVPSPLYVLKVRDRFEAAHHLRSYQGRPEAVHGHSWQVEVRLEAPELDKEGMGFDFVAVRDALGEALRPFHHADINTVPPFDTLSPTTEHLARFFYEELSRRLPGAPIVSVTVWEGPDCSASYVLRR
jgi:6-pyruvoyltetrahydropterin/6-carboxytetrahydropterin synthase